MYAISALYTGARTCN